jgi:hypothetical protein
MLLAECPELLEKRLVVGQAGLDRLLGAADRVFRRERRLGIDDALLDCDRLVELVGDELFSDLCPAHVRCLLLWRGVR